MPRVLESLTEPDLCAFSVYVWNEQYSLTMARAIREKWPRCRIVFGGPQAGQQHFGLDFVDTVVFGEGERAFAKILELIHQGLPLPQIMREPRMEDLDIPSPYLDGLFDDIVANALPNQKFQTVIETNRGCPYACTYCDWGSLTYSKVKKFNLERVVAELEWIAARPIAVVFLADANFGIFRERDMEIARLMRHHWADSEVDYLILNFLKNSNRQVFEIAREIGPIHKSITLSLQTMNADTLRAVKRDNLKSNNLRELLALSHEYQIPTHTDMLIGMPLETLESWKSGLIELIEAGQDGYVDTMWVNLLENSELKQQQQLEFRLKTIRVEADTLQGVLQTPEAERDGIKEYSDIVCETSTMDRQDMRDAYMWHWLLQFFHSSGYSYIVSRYLYRVHGISMRRYYDTLLDSLANGQGALTDLYWRTVRATDNFLTVGNFGGEVDANEFPTANSYAPIYQNIDSAYQLVHTVAEQFAEIPPGIWLLQCHAVMHPDYPVGQEIWSEFDLSDWSHTPTLYRTVPKVDKFSGTYYNFLTHRRKLSWRNRIEKVV